MVKVRLEFGGGLDVLFGHEKEVEVDIPIDNNGEDDQLTIGKTLAWARDNLLTERPELFMKGATVRPGILVLINDTDWELSGLDDSPIEEGDRITFISTLHGG